MSTAVAVNTSARAVANGIASPCVRYNQKFSRVSAMSTAALSNNAGPAGSTDSRKRKNQPHHQKLKNIETACVIRDSDGAAIHQCRQHTGMGFYAGIHRAYPGRYAHTCSPGAEVPIKTALSAKVPFRNFSFQQVAGRNVGIGTALRAAGASAKG